MKPLSWLLRVSLVANVCLAITFLITARQSSTASHDHTSASTRSSSTSVETASRPSSTLAAGTSSSASIKTTPLWTKLYTTDIEQLIARLKLSGFTYQQIRIIVYQISGKKFEAAEDELFAQQEKTPYWKTPDSKQAKEIYAKYHTLMQERSAFYRQYLSGPEWLAENSDAADFARQRYGPLPLEKLQAINRIQNDYNDLAAKLSSERLARASTQITKEDRQKRRLLDAELERDIQQALTPEEFAEYQFRESFTAQRLREQLELLRLTETEYKAIFALQRPIDQQFDSWSPDKEGQAAYKNALEKINPQLEAALGSDRYADYKQLVESPNDEVVLMSRLDLPLATAGKITSLRNTVSEQAAVIRKDATLSPADRDARLATLAQETETKLATLLRTPRGYEAYTELKGDWLRALHSKP
ncbi:MAG: hypothetical protein QM760_16620 [Nibricoccus sp.]